MPRSIIPLTNLPGSVASSVPLAWTATDSVNGNEFVATGKNVVLARNTSILSATLTLESVADPFGRTGNLVLALAAGASVAFGPLGLLGWCQTSGYMNLSSSNSGVEVVVFS